MNESPENLFRKNNFSAYLFLITAILSISADTFFFIAFFLVFSSITAIFTGGGVQGSEINFYFQEAWYLYLLLLMCAATIVLQIAAFAFMKLKSKRGRIIGIAAFLATVVTFTPLALLLIYSFAFLVRNNGKYFYQQLNKH